MVKILSDKPFIQNLQKRWNEYFYFRKQKKKVSQAFSVPSILNIELTPLFNSISEAKPAKIKTFTWPEFQIPEIPKLKPAYYILFSFLILSYVIIESVDLSTVFTQVQRTSNQLKTDPTPLKLLDTLEAKSKSQKSEINDLDTIVEVKAESIPITMPTTGVVADVNSKKLYLVSKGANNKWSVKNTFDLARGKVAGDKKIEGDLKTPIGNYHIHEIVAGEKIGKLYGALIFKLDYPNKIDKSNGKTGSGIWIHGVEFGSPPTYTKGCIALANQNIIQLIPYLKLGSPIKIVTQFEVTRLNEMFSLEETQKSWIPFLKKYEQKIRNADEPAANFLMAEQFAKREKSQEQTIEYRRAGIKISELAESQVNAWAKAWSSQSAIDYGKLYHPNFKDKSGRNYQTFLDRKKTIFSSHDSIKVKVSDFRVYLKGVDTLKVRLFQSYTGFKPRGSRTVQREKHLLFSRHNEEWLIVKEI